MEFAPRAKIIYLPGWLNPGKNLAPLAETVGHDWDTFDLVEPDKIVAFLEYVKMIADKITEPAYIAGHSFGGKIAIAISALYPEKAKGIFVIAGSNRGKLIFRLLRPAIKLAKLMGLSGRGFQASDYKNSSPVMKHIMRSTLDFDIMPLARKVKCPAVFIYGANDTATPPKLGKKLARAAHGRFFMLNGYNHNSIISDGAYQAGAVIRSVLGICERRPA